MKMKKTYKNAEKNKQLTQKPLAMLLALTLLFAGCQPPTDKATSESSPASETSNSKTDTFVTPSYHVDSRLTFSSKYDYIVLSDNCFYASYIDGSQLGVAILDKETAAEKNTFTLPSSSADYYVANMTVDTEDNLYVLTTGYDYRTAPLLWRISTDGNVTAWSDFELTDLEYSPSPTLKGIQIDKDGTFYLWYNIDLPLSLLYEGGQENIYKYIDRIYIMPADSDHIFYVQTEEELQNFFLGANGSPLLISCDYKENRACIQKIDMEKQSLSDDVVYLNDAANSSLNLSGNLAVTENGFYFCQDENLYHYYYANGQIEYVATLSSFGIMEKDILSFWAEDDGFGMIDYYKDAPGYTIIKEGRPQKESLTLGTISSQTDSINQVIADFNRYNPDIEVTLYDYNHNAVGIDKAIENLKLDIISGTAPDILNCSLFNTSFLTSKGGLLDLYEFMSGDSVINRDNLLPSVVNTCEQDGCLYTISPSFNLQSIWGSRTVWGNQNGLSLQELENFLQSQGKDLNAIYGFSADEPVLTTMCTFGMNNFIDWNHFTCDFTSDYFKNMLTFTKEYTGNYSEPEVNGIRDGDILLSIGTISNIAYYQYCKQLYGDELSYVGYPTEQGSGTAITLLCQLGINSTCKNPDAAWEFLRFFLLNGYDGQGIPTLKSTFDEVMAAAMTEEYFTNEDGTPSSSPVAKAYYTSGDETFLIYAATQQDVDAFRALIDSADSRFEYNEAIMEIITEEAGAYLANQKSVDETAEIIQNRVSLYLAEQAP